MQRAIERMRAIVLLGFGLEEFDTTLRREENLK